MFVLLGLLVKVIIQCQIGCSYINKKCMCHQTFQRPSKYFRTSIGWLGTYLYNSIAYGFIHLLYCPSFFVVKPIKAINMKSNVCNSLNYSAQYWASWLTIKDLYCMGFSKTWRYLRLQIFLSREGKIVYLFFKNNWKSNFTKLSTAETKILTTSQTKNAQARQTSSIENPVKFWLSIIFFY